MIISESTNDQLMVMAAHRYCLGRRSYIVGSCVEWINAHWDQFTISTQLVMLRDTLEAINDKLAGDYIDEQLWINFAKNRILALPSDSKSWLSNAVSYKLNLDEWLENAKA